MSDGIGHFYRSVKYLLNLPERIFVISCATIAGKQRLPGSMHKASRKRI